jgi:ABC-2 type transport system permease protein
MRSTLACGIAVMKTKFAERMAYRGDFFISVFMMLIGDMMIPLITLLIYRSGAAFPGWTLEEAIMIQAVFTLSKGIAFPFFFGMVWRTLSLVREGTYDTLLIKPRSVLFITMVSGFDIDDFGRLVSGGVLFAFALSSMTTPNPMEWLQFGLLFLLSLSVLLSFSLYLSGLLFRWVGSSRVYDIFDSATMFGFYPGTIFSRKFQHLFTLVIPIAMIGFLPAAALLGRPSTATAASAVVCVIFLAAGLWFWHYMLSKYTSAGG